MDYSEPFRSSSPFKMGNGMDRLERLFSKKKQAAVSGSSNAHRHHSIAHQSSTFSSTFMMAPATAASIVASSDLHFPQPSFIRPRASRMVPRDDTTAYCPRPEPSGRALSIPDSEHSEQSELSAASAASSSPSSKATSQPRAAHGHSHSHALPRVPVGKAGRRAGHRVFNRRNTTHDAYQWLATSAEPFTTRLTRSTSNGSTSSSVGAADVAAAVAAFPRIPKRSSSLRDRRDASAVELANVQVVPHLRYSTSASFSSGEVSPATNASQPSPSTAMTTPRTTESQMSAAAAAAAQAPQLKLHLDELQDLQPLFLHTRTDTPPPSDHEMLVADGKGLLPSATIVPQQPTPEASPKMASNKTLPPSPATRRKMRSSMRRPISMRYTAVEPTPAAASTPVLREPNLGDFLSLSDDDIAENGPQASATSASTSTESKRLTAERVLPATPPLQQEQQPQPQQPEQEVRPASASSVSSVSPPVSPTSSSPSSSAPRRRTLRRSNDAPSRPPSCLAPARPLTAMTCSSPSPSPSVSAQQSSLAAALARPQSLAGQARMAAAFEIARIASQYNFDLAYIATIWPKNMAILHSSSSSSLSSVEQPPSPRSSRTRSRTSMRSSARYSTSSTNTTNRNSHHQGSPAPMSPNRAGLEAQFLAAYGLATVQAPYSLSAPTHAKILNNTASRWLEFHNETGDEHHHQLSGDFATGYGCAFYPGHAPVAQKRHRNHIFQRKMSSSSADEYLCCDADTELDDLDEAVIEEEDETTSLSDDAGGRAATPRPRVRHHQHNNNNRGIVFVAYRRQGASDATQGGGPVDLDALYRDVEALVDRILDVHMQQQRQSQLEQARKEVQAFDAQREAQRQSALACQSDVFPDEDTLPRSPTKRLCTSALAGHGCHSMGAKVY